MRKIIPVALVLAAAGTGLALSTGCPAPTAQASTTESVRTLGALPSLAPLVDRLSPAVVNVNVEVAARAANMNDPLEQFRFYFGIPDGSEGSRQSRVGQGSGFVISADGYILSNNHVVSGADKVTVTFQDGETRTAELVGSDPRTDVALLKVKGNNLPYVPLGSSEDTRVGDWVVAIGNPFGLGHTVTAGIISAKGRALGAGPYDDFLQTDAAINPGNSGGPLFNLHGEVVGINTAVVPRANTIGFSIPIDMVTEMLDELKQSGTVARGWLGVGVRDLDAAVAAALELKTPQGALIGEVHQGTPAAAGGLKSNDVVLALNGQDIQNREALVRSIGRHNPGETVVLTLRRGSKTVKLDITLGERPDESALQTRYGRGLPKR
jgi:serine protease Do